MVILDLMFYRHDINNGIEEFRQSDDGFSDGNPINGGGSGGFTSTQDQ